MIYKISGLLLLGGLAGCTMGPDYRKVEPVVPKHWQAESTGSRLGTCPELCRRAGQPGVFEKLVEKFRRCPAGPSDESGAWRETWISR